MYTIDGMYQQENCIQFNAKDGVYVEDGDEH